MCFYSILVRLEGAGVGVAGSLGFVFLFHTGSIRGGVKPAIELTIFARFYSILVRLEGTAGVHLGVMGLRFYSILVRLEVDQRGRYPRVRTRFYSILVRLEEVQAPNRYRRLARFYSILVRLEVNHFNLTTARKWFLFHTGSIRGRPRPHRALSIKKVSIPYWFD